VDPACNSTKYGSLVLTRAAKVRRKERLRAGLKGRLLQRQSTPDFEPDVNLGDTSDNEMDFTHALES
jgi:hypothetical protein